MSYSNPASLFRMLLLAMALGVQGCAADRPALGKMDWSKIQQADWWPWRQEPQPKTAVPVADAQAPVAPPVIAAAPIPIPAAPAAAAPPRLVLAAPQSVRARPVMPPAPAGAAAASAQAVPPVKPVRAASPQVKQPVTGARQASAAAPPPRPAAAVKPAPAEVPQALAVVPLPESVPPRKAARYSPDDLVGLDGRAVERILGKPDLSRQEPFAEVWQYTHGGCVLFLFLYPTEDGPAQVSYAETGARDGGTIPDPAACIGAVAARQTVTPG